MHLVFNLLDNTLWNSILRTDITTLRLLNGMV